jgi:stearoyl-CoA 9-desaturase NADPH oxidoreductase
MTLSGIVRHVDFWLGELGSIQSLTELRARVVDVVDETHDVKTFVLAPGATWPGHRAGQYVPVDVEIDGVRVRRCYSISSGPSRPRAPRIAITVKRMPGGRVSTWMHEHLRRGARVTLGTPAGEFVLPADSAPKLLLWSGGSGVTPVMSILRELAARDAIADVVFLHSARSRHDVVFRREVEALATRFAGLRVVYLLDDERGASAKALASRLATAAPDFAERATFLCGPGGMMDAAARIWAEAGASDRLVTERFALASPSIARRGVEGAKVLLARSGREVTTSGAGTLLEQLEGAGERPAHGCRMGICNTCRCRKRSGVVEDMVTGKLSSEPDEEIRLCVSVARSDLELSL